MNELVLIDWINGKYSELQEELHLPASAVSQLTRHFHTCEEGVGKEAGWAREMEQAALPHHLWHLSLSTPPVGVMGAGAQKKFIWAYPGPPLLSDALPAMLKLHK